MPGGRLTTPWGDMVWHGSARRSGMARGWVRREHYKSPAPPHLVGPRDAQRYHQLAGQAGYLCILLQARQEEVSLNVRGDKVPPPGDAGEALIAAIPAAQIRGVLARAAQRGLLGRARPDWACWGYDPPYLVQFSWPAEGRLDSERWEHMTVALGDKAEFLAVAKELADAAPDGAQMILGALEGITP